MEQGRDAETKVSTGRRIERGVEDVKRFGRIWSIWGWTGQGPENLECSWGGSEVAKGTLKSPEIAHDLRIKV